MVKVIIESPFAGNKESSPYDYEHEVADNKAYLQLAMLDSLHRGEAPFASHQLYTDCLKDELADERKLGIEAGLVWGAKAEKTVIYIDRGMSSGMLLGVADAIKCCRPVEYRSLGAEHICNWSKEASSALFKHMIALTRLVEGLPRAA